MPPLKSLLPLGLALAFPACVSLEEAPMAKGAVQPGQRTVVAAYVAPGPSIAESDTKVETAAKILPGLGLVVQSAQEDRELAASKDLQQYLPDWKPLEQFHPLLMHELSSVNYPGRFVTPAEAELSSDTLKAFNKADNLLDWRLRYVIESPERPVPRNYASILSLDDALILEANLLYGVASVPGDMEGNMSPTLTALVKFYRAGTMRLLWRHEETVEDKAGARSLYEFKVEPNDLVSKWQKLLPQLAQRAAASLGAQLTGIPLPPPTGAQPPAPSFPPSAPQAPATPKNPFQPLAQPQPQIQPVSGH